MASHSLTHDQLLAALERRFDYLSARSVASELLGVAGVPKADHYDAAASAKLRAAAETSLTRAHAVLEALAAPAHAHAPVAKEKEVVAPVAAEVAPPPPEAVAAIPSASDAAEDAAPAEKVDKKKKA